MRLPRFIVLLLALTIVFSAPTAAAARDDRVPTLTVMTLNLYVGFDVASVFASPDFASFQSNAAAAWANVQATDFAERADALALLVAEHQPDVIGLQEATLWTTGPLFNPAPAQTVAYDFTELLLDALEAQGESYELAESVTNLTFEAPVIAAGMDIGVADRDAILVRNTDQAGFEATNAQSGHFAAAISIPFLGGTLAQPRGWVSVDVKHRGQTVRVVNTHLEAFAAPIRDAQTAELLAGPLAGTDPAILIGDLNARADGSAPGTYGAMLNAGFADAWTETNETAAGFTCCQHPDLLHASTLSERIDYVLFRGDPRTLIRATGSEVVGEEEGDRTISGMWPSDHAGVVASFAIRGDGGGSD